MFNKSFNATKIRKDFPPLEKGVIYLDNACMSLKPIQVIEKINEYYKNYPACCGRSLHKFSNKVGEEVEKSRGEIKNLINARKKQEIIFSKNTTEGINLVANGLQLKPGDEIILTDKEHNSNLIPWLKLSKEKGVVIKITESDKDNCFSMENFEKILNEKTKLVSIVHTSNLDGVTNPIKEIIQKSHSQGALVLIDGAQSTPHKEIDVRELNADFFVFSGHKMLGPTGTGVLYGKKELLEKLNQFLVGGQTVIDSTYTGYEPEELPMKFEAGLQNYAGIIGLSEATKYLKRIGLKKIEKHEIKLNEIITSELGEKVDLIGPKDPALRGGIFSFNIEGMDPHHIAKILDSSKNIAIRSGAHCVHSWFNKHKLKGSARASIYFYNTEDEAQTFADEVKKILKMS